MITTAGIPKAALRLPPWASANKWSNLPQPLSSRSAIIAALPFLPADVSNPVTLSLRAMGNITDRHDAALFGFGKLSRRVLRHA